MITKRSTSIVYKHPQISIVLLLLLAMGCSTPNLKIENLQLKATGDEEIIKLDADGQVWAFQKKIGLLGSDGTLKDMDNKTIAHIDNDGLVYAGDSKLGQLQDNGDMDNGSGIKLAWAEDGKLLVSEGQYLTIEPNDKKLRKTASFLFMLYSSFNVGQTAELEIIAESGEDSLRQDTIKFDNLNFKKQELMATKNNNTLKITGYIAASVESGTLGGSLKDPAFQSVFHYSMYSVLENKDVALNAEFGRLINAGLDNTMVNGLVNLRVYLGFVKDNDAAKLAEIHKDYTQPKTTGSKTQSLPSLFFLEGNENPLRVRFDDLKISGSFFDLNTFLNDHGKHFESTIPDPIITEHYPEYKYFL